MINSMTLFPETRFAGKKAQNKPSVFKTALVGSLLASAGAGASLTGPKPTALTQSSLTLDHAHLSHALTKAAQTNWDELIRAKPLNSFDESDSKKNDLEGGPTSRKLLNKKRPANPPTSFRIRGWFSPAKQAQPRLLSETTAQSAWNASSLTPLNYELLSQVTFPFTSPMTPAPLKPYTEAEIKAQLVPFINKITCGNRAKNAEALTVFNDPILKQKTNNDPKIRAMLASLQALGFDSVIKAYKSNLFSALKFNPVPFQDATGYSVRVNNETQQQIWLNPRYQGEDWKQLIDTVLHEALHDDTIVGNAEELINTAMDSLVGTKVRLLDPTIITQNTELSRRLNTASLYRLTSRGPNGELRMNSTKPNVLPLRNFGARYGISKPEDVQPSPGNPLLASLLKIFTGKTVTNPNFDWNTIQLLDQNQKYLSYSELLQAAKLLQLNAATSRRLRSMDELAEGPAIAPSIAESEAIASAPAPEPFATEDDQALAPRT